MHLSFPLPAEIWEKILDLLDTSSLLNCQHTCQEWRSIVLSYVLSGRLKNRALVSKDTSVFVQLRPFSQNHPLNQIHHRLSFYGRDLHHKRSIWNTICFVPSADVIITGIGVYTGHFDDLFSDEATIVFERDTTTINVWTCDGFLVATQTLILDTQRVRELALEAPRQHTVCLHLANPFVGAKGCSYDVEHNLSPTDVTNHFSGAPFTLMGADLWTCYGSVNTQTSGSFFSFSSVGERRRGRCCLELGQLPYFLYWPHL